MISLREGELTLLPLRGSVRTQGDRRFHQNRVALVPGMEIYLRSDLSLQVVSMALPSSALAVRIGGAEPVVLSRTVYSLLDAPARLEERYLSDAQAQIWSDGDGWMARCIGGAPRPLTTGTLCSLGGEVVEVVSVEATGTIQAPAHTPLRIVAFADTAHIYRKLDSELLLALSGISAWILSELVMYNEIPVRWEDIAGAIPKRKAISDRETLCVWWHTNLSKLRRKLRSAGVIQRDGVRQQLIRSDGKNHVQLMLLPHDELADRC